MFPSVARNISVLLVFLSGLMFAPQDYYDLLVCVLFRFIS